MYINWKTSENAVKNFHEGTEIWKPVIFFAFERKSPPIQSETEKNEEILELEKCCRNKDKALKLAEKKVSLALGKQSVLIVRFLASFENKELTARIAEFDRETAMVRDKSRKMCLKVKISFCSELYSLSFWECDADHSKFGARNSPPSRNSRGWGPDDARGIQENFFKGKNCKFTAKYP